MRFDFDINGDMNEGYRGKILMKVRILGIPRYHEWKIKWMEE